MIEVWKSIPDYEGIYEVSSLGRVKSLSRKIFDKNNKFIYTQKEIILKQVCDKVGYYRVNLLKDGNKKTYKAHQLVAIAFLGHIPCGYKLVVDHINDNPKDNRVENLQIVTQRENAFKTQGKYSSQYKGVCWFKQLNKWRAYIRINGKNTHLGCFINEYEAHLAYQNKLKEIQ